MAAVPVKSGDEMLIAAATHMPPALKKQVMDIVGLPPDQQRAKLRQLGGYLGDRFLYHLADSL